MKCMLIYCKDPKVKSNPIIDLARGYRHQGLIDMTPVRLFFMFEVPFKFPLEKCRELISNILERFRSRHPFAGNMNPVENLYQIFDMIFMPIITRYAENDVMFHSLFNDQMMRDFMETFFGISRANMPKVDEIKYFLDNSQFYSSEQFLIDICKVLNLICRYFEFHSILAACPNSDIFRVNKFLLNCSKRSRSPMLAEWGYYT
jgi:hypothetical protein